MHIVTQALGRLMALFTKVYTSVMALLLNRVKPWLVNFTQIYRSVQHQYLLNLLRVQTLSSFNHLRVSLTTAAQLIKAALISVKQTLIQTGSQLVTTVRQILQRAKNLLKKG